MHKHFRYILTPIYLCFHGPTGTHSSSLNLLTDILNRRKHRHPFMIYMDTRAHTHCPTQIHTQAYTYAHTHINAHTPKTVPRKGTHTMSPQPLIHAPTSQSRIHVSTYSHEEVDTRNVSVLSGPIQLSCLLKKGLNSPGSPGSSIEILWATKKCSFFACLDLKGLGTLTLKATRTLPRTEAKRLYTVGVMTPVSDAENRERCKTTKWAERLPSQQLTSPSAPTAPVPIFFL